MYDPQSCFVLCYFNRFIVNDIPVMFDNPKVLAILLDVHISTKCDENFFRFCHFQISPRDFEALAVFCIVNAVIRPVVRHKCQKPDIGQTLSSVESISLDTIP